MEIDDYEICPKRSKFSSQFVSQLGNQFHNIVRISNCQSDRELINIHSSDGATNFRKRLSSSLVLFWSFIANLSIQ